MTTRCRIRPGADITIVCQCVLISRNQHLTGMTVVFPNAMECPQEKKDKREEAQKKGDMGSTSGLLLAPGNY